MNRNFQQALAVSLALHVVALAAAFFATSGGGEVARLSPDLPVVLLVPVQEDPLAPTPVAPPAPAPPPPKLEPVPAPPPPVVESPVSPVAVMKPERAHALVPITPPEAKPVDPVLPVRLVPPVPQAGTTAANAMAALASTPPAARAEASSALSSAAPVLLSGPVKYRHAPDPEYPLLARRRRQEGTVLLAVVIATNGRPADIVLKQSSGFLALDRAALEAVPHWEFEIRTTAPVRAEIPVRFQLVK